MIEFVVKEDGAGQRLDKLVRKLLERVPLSHIYKMVRTKKVRVNGARTTIEYKLQPGDKVTIFGEERTLLGPPLKRTPAALVSAHYNFVVLHEDAHILVCDKPAGLAVHTGTGIFGATLVDQARGYIGGEYAPGEFKPSPAHRLDRETSGVVIVAKTRAAMVALAKQFEENHPDKRYLALVKGHLHQREGTIDLPLSEHQQTAVSKQQRGVNMQQARTRWRSLARAQDISLVECTLETGRTHQIRRHLASIGHPIVGDSKYGDFPFNRRAKTNWGVRRQLLHAASLTIRHPADGRVAKFAAPLPADFRSVAERAGLPLPPPS